MLTITAVAMFLPVERNRFGDELVRKRDQPAGKGNRRAGSGASHYSTNRRVWEMVRRYELFTQSAFSNGSARVSMAWSEGIAIE